MFSTKSPALAPVNEIAPIVKSSGKPIFSKTMVNGAELESRLMLPRFSVAPVEIGDPLKLTCNSCTTEIFPAVGTTVAKDASVTANSNPSREKNNLLNRLKVNIKSQNNRQKQRQSIEFGE